MKTPERSQTLGTVGRGGRGNVRITVQPLWGTVIEVLQKLKIELSYGSSISLLGIYLKKQNTNLKRLSATKCSLQHYLQQPNNISFSLMNKWVKKMCYVQSTKKKILPCVATCMNLRGIYAK